MTNILAYLSLREKGSLLPLFQGKVVLLARPPVKKSDTVRKNVD